MVCVRFSGREMRERTAERSQWGIEERLGDWLWVALHISLGDARRGLELVSGGDGWAGNFGVGSG